MTQLQDYANICIFSADDNGDVVSQYIPRLSKPFSQREARNVDSQEAHESIQPFVSYSTAGQVQV